MPQGRGGLCRQVPLPTASTLHSLFPCSRLLLFVLLPLLAQRRVRRVDHVEEGRMPIVRRRRHLLLAGLQLLLLIRFSSAALPVMRRQPTMAVAVPVVPVLLQRLRRLVLI